MKRFLLRMLCLMVMKDESNKQLDLRQDCKRLHLVLRIPHFLHLQHLLTGNNLLWLDLVVLDALMKAKTKSISNAIDYPLFLHILVEIITFFHSPALYVDFKGVNCWSLSGSSNVKPKPNMRILGDFHPDIVLPFHVIIGRIPYHDVIICRILYYDIMIGRILYHHFGNIAHLIKRQSVIY